MKFRHPITRLTLAPALGRNLSRRSAGVQVRRSGALRKESNSHRRAIDHTPTPQTLPLSHITLRSWSPYAFPSMQRISRRLGQAPGWENAKAGLRRPPGRCRSLSKKISLSSSGMAGETRVFNSKFSLTNSLQKNPIDIRQGGADHRRPGGAA